MLDPCLDFRQYVYFPVLKQKKQTCESFRCWLLNIDHSKQWSYIDKVYVDWRTSVIHAHYQYLFILTYFSFDCEKKQFFLFKLWSNPSLKPTSTEQWG